MIKEIKKTTEKNSSYKPANNPVLDSPAEYNNIPIRKLMIEGIYFGNLFSLYFFDNKNVIMMGAIIMTIIKRNKIPSIIGLQIILIFTLYQFY